MLPFARAHTHTQFPIHSLSPSCVPSTPTIFPFSLPPLCGVRSSHPSILSSSTGIPPPPPPSSSSLSLRLTRWPEPNRQTFMQGSNIHFLVIKLNPTQQWLVFFFKFSLNICWKMEKKTHIEIQSETSEIFLNIFGYVWMSLTIYHLLPGNNHCMESHLWLPIRQMFTTENQHKSWTNLTVCAVQKLSLDSQQCAVWLNSVHYVSRQWQLTPCSTTSSHGIQLMTAAGSLTDRS